MYRIVRVLVRICIVRVQLSVQHIFVNNLKNSQYTEHQKLMEFVKINQPNKPNFNIKITAKQNGEPLKLRT